MGREHKVRKVILLPVVKRVMKEAASQAMGKEWVTQVGDMS